LMAPRTARVPTLRQCVMQNQDSPYEWGSQGAQVRRSVRSQQKCDI